MAKIPVYSVFPAPRLKPKEWSVEREARYRTNVWATERMIEQLTWYQRHKEKHKGFFVKKLERYAIDGFDLYQGDDRPVRLEWDQVYRIGHQSTLFRVIGFYVGNPSEFIAVDAYLKSGMKLKASERERINHAAQLRASGNWVKREVK